MTKSGDHIWYELLTSDPDSAEKFYSEIVGWTFSRPSRGAVDYRVLSAPDADVGGLMTLPPEAPMAPLWLAYVAVTDVDASAGKVTELGGSVHVPPQDIPGVGRFALVADPQGAVFYLMRGNGDVRNNAFDPVSPGHCSWHELVTTDQTAALAFYSELFGWTKGEVMPMGESGDYQFIHHGDRMIGAMMNRSPDSPPPMWNYYFRVDDIDEAVGRVWDNGGTMLFGPVEVPGGDWVIQAADPQGARFSLVGARS